MIAIYILCAVLLVLTTAMLILFFCRELKEIIELTKGQYNSSVFEKFFEKE